MEVRLSNINCSIWTVKKWLPKAVLKRSVWKALSWNLLYLTEKRKYWKRTFRNILSEWNLSFIHWLIRNTELSSHWMKSMLWVIVWYMEVNVSANPYCSIRKYWKRLPLATIWHRCITLQTWREWMLFRPFSPIFHRLECLIRLSIRQCLTMHIYMLFLTNCMKNTVCAVMVSTEPLIAMYLNAYVSTWVLNPKGWSW